MSSDSYCTPREIVDPLHDFYEGPPDFDPASNPSSIVGARTEYHAGALHLDWCPQGGARTAYENPPYSGINLLAFTNKGIAEMHRGNVWELVRLVPASTSTQWWRRACGTEPVVLHGANMYASRSCVVAFTKRIKFINPDTGLARYSARHESVLFYYGNRSKRFLECFRGVINWHTFGTAL